MTATTLKTGSRVACFSCNTPHDPSKLQTVCDGCGLPLRVSVPLPTAEPKAVIDSSIDSMWRYAALFAIPAEAAVSLGEGWTPLISISDRVFVKDESRNPTGSFKDRGMSMAVSAARMLGATRVVAPSAGNAAMALAAYGREAKMEVLVAMPSDTPSVVVERCRDYGAEVQLVDGDISTAGRWLAANQSSGDFDLSTLKEPYRVEGKKTMGYEIWEQLGFELPSVVLYPTGGGTGLVGMWKAWDEMEQMGWIGEARPRLVSVQSVGCAPIVKAYNEGLDDISPWPDPVTSAWGLRVPSPIGGFLCLRAIKKTGGSAIAILENEIHLAARRAAKATGIDFCPEGGAVWAALELLQSRGEIGAEETALIWNTGAGENYR